jgi:hypothetical protein
MSATGHKALKNNVDLTPKVSRKVSRCCALAMSSAQAPAASEQVAFLPARGETPVTDTFPSLNGQLAFEPEATRAMGIAFDEVCRALFVPADAKTIREAIAEKIIEHARSVERDPDRLRDLVLKQVGMRPRPGHAHRQSA